LDEHLIAMDQFESRLRKSPELLTKFKQAKAVLIANPELVNKVDSNFVEGIMMLDLED